MSTFVRSRITISMVQAQMKIGACSNFIGALTKCTCSVNGWRCGADYIVTVVLSFRFLRLHPFGQNWAARITNLSHKDLAAHIITKFINLFHWITRYKLLYNKIYYDNMSLQSFCIFFPAISFALESTLPHNQSVPLRGFGFLLFASNYYWSKQYYSIENEGSYHSSPRTNESQQDVKQWRVAQIRNAACMRLLAPREFWRQNCLDLLLSIEYSYFTEFS